MANMENLQNKLDKLLAQEKILEEKRKGLEQRISKERSRDVERLLKEFNCSVPELKSLLLSNQTKKGDKDESAN